MRYISKSFLCVRKCGQTVSLVLFDILHKDWFPVILEQGWMLILAWFLGWFYCSHNPSCIISIVDPCFPQSFFNSQSFVTCNLTKKKEHYVQCELIQIKRSIYLWMQLGVDTVEQFFTSFVDHQAILMAKAMRRKAYLSLYYFQFPSAVEKHLRFRFSHRRGLLGISPVQAPTMVHLWIH